MKHIFIFALLCITLGCSQKTIDTKAEGEKIMQLSREWSEAAAAGNVEKAVSYWADDAVLMSEGQQPLEGKASIRKMVEESFKMPGFRISWKPKSVQVSESGDMAYLIEDSQITYNDSTGQAVTHNLNAVTIWRKQKDGTWKNVVDISTPSPE